LSNGQAITESWKDPRIVRGMTEQLELRKELLASGMKPLGWKLAFGGAAAMERLKTTAPLVGFLMDRAVVSSGSIISIDGWKKPAAEPELAVYIGKNLAAGSDRQTTVEAIEALGPAIEIADVTNPPEDVEQTLACDIYQRHVAFGSRDSTRAGGRLDGFRCQVSCNGRGIEAPEDIQAFTGELIQIVQHTADVLGAFGESLRAGELIITGSMIPPISVQSGDKFEFTLSPLGTISVHFSG
jgi:2-keto-4-pentenoate hydratase